MAVLIYVDDIVVIGNNATAIAQFKLYLDAQFKLKDMGPLKFFLGLEVARSKGDCSSSTQLYVPASF